MIPYEMRRPVYEAALSRYGVYSQLWKAIEEMSELTNEIAKDHAGGSTQEALIDEIADVTIMMEQLRLIYDVNEAVQERIDFKMRRLAQRIGYEGGGLE